MKKYYADCADLSAQGTSKNGVRIDTWLLIDRIPNDCLDIPMVINGRPARDYHFTTEDFWSFFDKHFHYHNNDPDNYPTQSILYHEPDYCFKAVPID